MSYQLEGHMIEVCSCESLCPCFVNREPDGGTCDVAVAWHIEKGEVEGVNVAGRTLAVMARLPGNHWMADGAQPCILTKAPRMPSKRHC